MKILFLFFTVIFSNLLVAQKVIISGKEGNRPLKWADFTGNPDNSSPYFAQTYWTIRYNVGNVTVVNNQVQIGTFEVILEFAPQGSWLKQGKASAYLLKHEQGHFDAGILCMNEILRFKKETLFTPSNFKEKLASIFNETLAKYTEMGKRYDAETNHSINEEKQLEWDTFFENQLLTTK